MISGTDGSGVRVRRQCNMRRPDKDDQGHAEHQARKSARSKSFETGQQLVDVRLIHGVRRQLRAVQTGRRRWRPGRLAASGLRWIRAEGPDDMGDFRLDRLQRRNDFGDALAGDVLKAAGFVDPGRRVLQFRRRYRR